MRTRRPRGVPRPPDRRALPLPALCLPAMVSAVRPGLDDLAPRRGCAHPRTRPDPQNLMVAVVIKMAATRLRPSGRARRYPAVIVGVIMPESPHRWHIRPDRTPDDDRPYAPPGRIGPALRSTGPVQAREGGTRFTPLSFPLVVI